MKKILLLFLLATINTVYSDNCTSEVLSYGEECELSDSSVSIINMLQNKEVRAALKQFLTHRKVSKITYTVEEQSIDKSEKSSDIDIHTFYGYKCNIVNNNCINNQKLQIRTTMHFKKSGAARFSYHIDFLD